MSAILGHSSTTADASRGARLIDTPAQGDIVRAAAMRPLVVRCGALGDMVLITALLAQLQARLGQPADVISCGPWTRPLLEGHPLVGDLFIVKSRRTPYLLNGPQQRMVQWLRDRGAGPTWFCDADSTVRDLLARAGIPDSYVCDARAMDGYDGEHFVDRWIRLANLTPPAFADILPPTRCTVARAAQLQIAPHAQLELDRWLERHGLAGRRFIAIQAGNKRSMRGWYRKRPTNTKYWPEDRWARVIRGLRELQPDDAILLLGVPREHGMNAAIEQLAGVSGVYNVADDVPIATLLPLLQRATGMIGVDTGPTHVAAAVGCPTLALFGEADPCLYRPGGVTTPALTLTGQSEGRPSILGITAEDVIAGWLRLGEVDPQRRCTRSRA